MIWNSGSQTFLISQFSKDVPKCPLDPALHSWENIFDIFFSFSHQILEGCREDIWEGCRDKGLSPVPVTQDAWLALQVMEHWSGALFCGLPEALLEHSQGLLTTPLRPSRLFQQSQSEKCHFPPNFHPSHLSSLLSQKQEGVMHLWNWVIVQISKGEVKSDVWPRRKHTQILVLKQAISTFTTSLTEANPALT